MTGSACGEAKEGNKQHRASVPRLHPPPASSRLAEARLLAALVVWASLPSPSAENPQLATPEPHLAVSALSVSLHLRLAALLPLLRPGAQSARRQTCTLAQRPVLGPRVSPRAP